MRLSTQVSLRKFGLTLLIASASPTARSLNAQPHPELPVGARAQVVVPHSAWERSKLVGRVDSVSGNVLFLTSDRGVRASVPLDSVGVAIAAPSSRLNGARAGARMGGVLGLALAPAVVAGVWWGSDKTTLDQTALSAVTSVITFSTIFGAGFGLVQRSTRWVWVRTDRSTPDR